MSLNELINFLKNKGFKSTFEVLSKFKNYKAEKRKFYEELRKFSYYNAFYRIKDRLIENNLINIREYSGKEYISLTKKGVLLYQKLTELNDIIRK